MDFIPRHVLKGLDKTRLPVSVGPHPVQVELADTADAMDPAVD